MVTVCGKSVNGNPALVSKRTLDCYYKLKQRIAEGVGRMAVRVSFERCAIKACE